MTNNLTEVWKLYERGRSYNNQLVPNYYSLVNTNIEFFCGNQWVHLPQTRAMSRLPKPTFNIIKRVASLFVASLTSTNVALNFDSLSYYDGENTADQDSNASVFANAEVRNLMEKFNMEYRIRDALFDGAQTGDYCAHFFWDADALPYGGAFGQHRGEIKMELVDGVNIMFGNPNTPDVESQPYILVLGRDTVESLREEAKRFKKNHSSGKPNDAKASMLDGLFQPDNDYIDQAAQGGSIELESDDKHGKALYAYMYFKVTKEEDEIDEMGNPVMEDELDENGDPVPEIDENGNNVLDVNGEPVPKRKKSKRLVTSVRVTKATKSQVIFEDVDTGLTRYPIAWGNWEKQKNQYHGRALVTGIIPNQIYINSQFATVMYHLQQLGFPKIIYNADLIGHWNNEVGQAIGVSGLLPDQGIEHVARAIQPADMSNQILTVIDKAINLTKDCLGATDAQMGNVSPDNTSALMVLQSSAEVPLENVRAGLYEWMESIGAILLDMMGTYYGKRPIVRERDFREPVMTAGGTPQIDPMTGTMVETTVKRRVVEEFDFRQFKKLYLNLSIDAGATNNYSEIAMIQSLDNMRQNGVIDTIQYLERLPDKAIPRRQELIDELKQKMQQEAQQQASSVAAAQAEAQEKDQLAAIGKQINPKGKTPQKAAPTMGGQLSTGNAVGGMPPGIQGQFDSLPTRAQNSLIRKASLAGR